MPDATITSTASTFGTISGIFSADQSTISGTISGIVPGNLTGSVGVPGPAGPAGIGLPAGGTSGQFLQKTSGVDYATDWVTVNLTGLATESWVTAGFYPLTGNPSGFLTAAALTPYLTSATAASTYQTLAGMSAYLTTSAAAAGYYPLSGNPSGFLTAASLSGYATESFVTSQGYITSAALTPYLLSATAATTYAPIAAGLPDNGAAGQILVKQSATAYDAEWQDNFATELRMPARNETGATLTKGTVVYISGGAGNKPLLSKALATGDATSAQTIGLVTADIANNSNGDVTIRGQLKDIDTSAFSVGAQLYLSGTTAGAYTATKTLAPTHLVYVGIVVRSNATEGAIEVAVQNGYELGEIHDVALSGLANNDLLAYESSTDLWKNKTFSALGLLTSADAASTYYLQTNPDGFLNAAVADTLYYGIGNPSNYLTNYDAAFSFYPLSGNPSSFLVAADIAGKADLASPTFTGVPLSTTAAVDTNTTQIATTAYVVGQGYLKSATASSTYQTLAGMSSYLTSADAATSYFTIASAANKADLASPALTGTPSLPTGTIGVTQTAGNNTTALATTAFVTAAVPAFATFTTPGVDSTNTIVSPRVAMDYLMHPGRTEWLKFGSGATSGTGASVGAPVSTRSVEVIGPNVGVAGYAMAVWDTSFSGFGMLGMTRGVDMGGRAWNKPVWASGRGQIGYYGNDVYNGDAHSTIRVSVGGKSAVGSGPITTGNPGFGWLIPGIGSALQLQVSNSITVTTVTSSFTPVAKQVFDWKMHSDGAGNVTLWINDDVVATTTAGPTTATAENYNFYFEMVEQTASTATRIVWESLNSRVWWGV